MGLLQSAGELRDARNVAVFHMANFRAGLELPGSMTAHAVGWTHDLSTDEESRIEDWLERLKTISSEVTYLACPANQVLTDSATGRAIGRTFSCSGFISACYAEALHISLVGESNLPLVGADVLARIWGPVLMHPRARRFVGVGPGPWPVLLPSYLFHALLGPRAGLPYHPKQADPQFLPQHRFRHNAHSWLRRGIATASPR